MIRRASSLQNVSDLTEVRSHLCLGVNNFNRRLYTKATFQLSTHPLLTLRLREVERYMFRPGETVASLDVHVLCTIHIMLPLLQSRNTRGM